jgi:hypothetical protein
MSKQDYLKYPEGSIYGSGYGVIPKAIMQSKDLSIEAKAIYAYLCSFMGSGDTAFPSVKKICFDLDINVKRYYRHMNQLVAGGYIVKTKAYYKVSGQWANNIYTIKHEVPGVEEEKQVYKA